MFREQLLSQTSRVIEPVVTPCGLTFVRSLTAGEKDRYDLEARKDGKYRCRLVLAACCTEDGRPEFGAQDLPAIDALPVHAIEPIVEAAMRVNRFTEADAEELRKN